MTTVNVSTTNNTVTVTEVGGTSTVVQNPVPAQSLQLLQGLKARQLLVLFLMGPLK